MSGSQLTYGGEIKAVTGSRVRNEVEVDTHSCRSTSFRERLNAFPCEDEDGRGQN
ncbi:hypothetical protein SESBI_05207 [Sesbania bispinosa]|nr:hypothetical protein SESBI_05207 [Sesbania bispinosa]